MDFPQLKGKTYLDSAGCPPVPKPIIEKVAEELLTTHYGNPHSMNSSSILTASRINEVKNMILEYLNTSSSEYSVLFTMNATGAFQFLGDAIDFDGKFVVLNSCHTSVVGMSTTFAVRRNCSENEIMSIVNEEDVDRILVEPDLDKKRNLFAFPAQCNFSGRRFKKDWTSKFRSKSNWLTIVDSASYSSTSQFDLSNFPADFLILSFYKIFGYPTGLGALIIRNENICKLKKKYVGGGTVSAIAVDPYYISNKKGIEGFENGTVPFQEIISLKYGFAYIKSRFGGWLGLESHCHDLAKLARFRMKAMKHQNGKDLVKIYGDCDNMGPILAFNILNSDGSVIGYTEVVRLAEGENILLRSGRFCNPGAAQLYLDLSSVEIRINHEEFGHVCGDSQDQLNGKPTGAIRVSFSFANTEADVDRLVEFLGEYFMVNKHIPSLPKSSPEVIQLVLKDIFIYPIKSCRGYRVKEWPLDYNRLLLDREFMLVDENDNVITQKQYPKLAMVKIININLYLKTIRIIAPNMDEIEFSFDNNHGESRSISICNTSSLGISVSPEISWWFSKYLEFSCKLISQSGNQKFSKGFNNKHGVSLLSSSSLHALLQSIPCSAERSHISAESFRPNFVADLEIPFVERDWIGKTLSIDGRQYIVEENCERCQMICIDHDGKRHREPLKTLSQTRLNVIFLNKRKIVFGVYLSPLLDQLGNKLVKSS